jgi:hypothetical protein
MKLADKFGLTKAVIDHLEIKLGKQKKHFIKLCDGDGTFLGELYNVTVVTAPRGSLDPDKVRKYLTPKQIAKCTHKKSVTTVTARAR